MKRSSSRIVVALLALSAVVVSSGAPDQSAQAAPSMTSITVPGFITMSSKIQPQQRASIAQFVSTHTGISTVSCVGYTGYNYLGVSKHRLKTLAMDRARKACNVAASAAGATVGSLSVKLTTSKKASSRKVVIRVAIAAVPGRYEYSMSTLDAGSEMHGGPVTGYFYEGDLVSATFADTAWSLDMSTPPEYGYMGTILSGTAAYFDHWNTASDDSGTKYLLGDRLGPIPDGTTVTLYAIPFTG